nr:DUF3037 domain-containing protein [Paraflavitalea speifideiaquila]
MQEQHLFEYAVIRVVPRVEREEFLNVGVILFASDLRSWIYGIGWMRTSCWLFVQSWILKK